MSDDTRSRKVVFFFSSRRRNTIFDCDWSSGVCSSDPKEGLGTFRVVTGLDGTLAEPFGPLRGWYWDVSLNYGRSSGTFTTAGAIRNSRIADAVGPSFTLPSGQAVCGNKGPDGIAGTADDVIIPGCVPLDLFGGPNNGSISP